MREASVRRSRVSARSLGREGEQLKVTRQGIGAAVFLLCSTTLFAAEDMAPGTQFENLAELRSVVRSSSEVTVIEGLPLIRVATPRCDSTKMVALHGYWFFADPIRLRGREAQRFASVVGDSLAFRPWRPKQCLGFHPDFCLEWRRGQEIHRALICLGCHEMKYHGPRAAVLCDVAPLEYKELKRLLQSYRSHVDCYWELTSP
jgi:hypothetical protein